MLWPPPGSTRTDTLFPDSTPFRSVLRCVINVVRSMRAPQTAPDDPWGGATLEWATSSPPPAHNFDTIPVVRDRDPVWYDRDNPVESSTVARGPVHLPPPSYYPLIVALGVGAIGVGLLSHLGIAVAGVLTVIYGTWGWAVEPTD